MERPFLFPLVSMIAGLTTATLTGWFVPSFICFPLLLAALCTIFITSRISFLLTISLLLFCTANLSLKPFLLPEHPRTDISNCNPEESTVIEGVIDSRPEPTETGWRITLQVEHIINNIGKIDAVGRLLLSIRNGRPELITGDRVRFSSRIKKPRNYGLPGEFDIERYMAFRNISAMAFILNSEDIILIGDSGQYCFPRQVDLIAKHLAEFINKNISSSEASVLRALLLGDKGVVAKPIKDAYTRAGVNHILSISGFHVGVIALFVFQIMVLAAKGSEFLLLRLNMRRLSLIFTIPVLIFYLFLSGTAPATIRSVIMIGVYILAMVMDREVDPLDSLMLAAVIILASSVPALFDLSFQLSFLAIWGILVLTPILVTPFKRVKGKLAGKMIIFLFASISAIAATIIPVAYYFHRTSVIGLLSNFFIVPLLGYGAVVLGFTALPFVYLSPFLAKVLLLAAAYMVKISNYIIMILAKLPIMPVFNPTPFQLALSFLFMAAITFINPVKTRVSCCLIIALIFAGSAILHGSSNKGKLVLTFFSVGQGESILVNFPDGKRMLIDGGGSAAEKGWDVGEKLLAPALWKMGIDSLDCLVLTHPHPDHIQGLKYVAENFKVGEFWEAGSYPDICEYRDLINVIKRKGIPIRKVTAASAPIQIGNARIEPLAPFVETSVKERNDYYDLNDESMVFRIKSGVFSILFTGDIGKEVEAVLVRHPELLNCNVLKLAHHGSRKSSSMEFLRAASPGIAVASAGYGNIFHLPSEETLGRLKALGIRLYRTDLDGSVQVIFDEMSSSPIIVRKIGHFH
jgi:competence protein ComEC